MNVETELLPWINGIVLADQFSKYLHKNHLNVTAFCEIVEGAIESVLKKIEDNNDRKSKVLRYILYDYTCYPDDDDDNNSDSKDDDNDTTESSEDNNSNEDDNNTTESDDDKNRDDDDYYGVNDTTESGSSTSIPTASTPIVDNTNRPRNYFDKCSEQFLDQVRRSFNPTNMNDQNNIIDDIKINPIGNQLMGKGNLARFINFP